MPISDSIIVLVMSALIIWQPFRMFVDSLREVAGGSADPELVAMPRQLTKEMAQGLPVEVLAVPVTKLGRSYFVVPYLKPEAAVSADDIDAFRKELEPPISNSSAWRKPRSSSRRNFLCRRKVPEEREYACSGGDCCYHGCVTTRRLARLQGTEMRLLRSLPVLLLLFVVGPDAACAAESSRRPNVVVILTDDQGTLDVNCFGASDLHTPNMDRLAKEGVRFTQAYAHMVCCPARAALMTGRHPQRGGVNDWTQGNLRARTGRNMALSEVTLAEALQQAGYRTGLFGKWHLGAAADSGPTRQGFDQFFGHRGGFIDNYKHYFLHQNGFHDLYEGTTEIFAEGKYFPEMNVARALAFLEENRDAPFFLYLPMNTPHYPEQPLARHLERYADLPEPRRTYAAFVSTTDELIGRVLDKLDDLKLTDDTIVILMSDNGHSTEQNAIDRDNHSSGLPKGHNYGANGGGGYTGRWIGHKATFLEGGIRVPAMIRYPARLQHGAVRDQAVTIMDWYPTVLQLCGLEPQAELDGRSLLDVIQSDKAPSPHRVLHFQWINTWAVRRGDWKLIHTQGRGENSVGRDRLYSLSDEQPESVDYAKQRPELVKQLRVLHERWSTDVFSSQK